MSRNDEHDWDAINKPPRVDKVFLYQKLTEEAYRAYEEGETGIAAELYNFSKLFLSEPGPTAGEYLKLEAAVSRFAESVRPSDDAAGIREFADDYAWRKDLAANIYQLADRLYWAGGKPFRRTCFCGRMTLSDRMYPEGWSRPYGSDVWTCRKHSKLDKYDR